MNCPSCGIQVSEGTAFCPQCGAQQTSAPSPQASPPAGSAGSYSAQETGQGGTYPPPPPPAGSTGGVYAGGGGYAGGGTPGGPSAQPPTNGKALWSLILSILGLCLCGPFTAIPAIILGKMAKDEIRQSGGAQGGEGMAQAGFIIGIIATILSIIGIILYVFVFAAMMSAGAGLSDPATTSSLPTGLLNPPAARSLKAPLAEGVLAAPLIASFVLQPQGAQGKLILGGAETPPLCVFNLLTGLPCPFCGLTRGFVNTAHFNLAEAFQSHLLAPALFSLCAGALGLLLLGRLYPSLNPGSALLSFSTQHSRLLISASLGLLLTAWVLKLILGWF